MKRYNKLGSNIYVNGKNIGLVLKENYKVSRSKILEIGFSSLFIRKLILLPFKKSE